MALTVKTLTRCGVPHKLARAHLPHMAWAMRARDITTRPRARAFLATVLHESMGLRAMNEIGGGRRYEGRGGLGNTHSGDGERFKGRGPIQLTGRANYEAYGRALGLNLVKHPQLVATPKVGWLVAACYFQKRAGVLKAADAGDFRRVTLLVNGGYNGWEDRLRYWKKLETLGVVPARHKSHDRVVKVAEPHAKKDHEPLHAVHGKETVMTTVSGAANVPAGGNRKTPVRISDDRFARLLRRLERLDAKSDRVRAQLATVRDAPRSNGARGGLSDAELVQALHRVDADSDELRRKLAARVSSREATLEGKELLALVKALGDLSERLSTAATATVEARLVAAPADGSYGNGSASTIQELEALDGQADRLRTALEQRLLQFTDGSAPAVGRPPHDRTERYLELLTRLDAFEAESDKVRHALRATSGATKRPVQARTFRLRSPEMKGDDVRKWQLHLNRRLHHWRIDYQLSVDGEYGKETALWSRRVLHGLGLPTADWHGVTPEARGKARNPRLRTPAELAAAGERKRWLIRLRKRCDAPKAGRKAAIAYAKKHADRRTAETHTNGGPFIDEWCRMVHMQPGTKDSPWCGAFVNACLVHAGLPSHDWVRYTPSIVNNARAGAEGWSWHSAPRVGDLVVFNWPGGDFVDHVGIVVAVNTDGSVRTVEGNFQNRVDYWRRSTSILGYARPPWNRAAART